jgi:hypothetical protein
VEQAQQNDVILAPSHMIDTVFSTGNNPWVGGCDFLRCFSSLYMYLEGIPPEHDTRYNLYRKFLAVTGMGMVTTFTLKDHNYSFEAAQDYTGRLHRFAGYDYRAIEAAEQDKQALFNAITHSIHLGRPVLAAFTDGEMTCKFQRKWRLFVGYNTEKMTLTVNEDGKMTVLANWFEHLDSVIIVTQTGLPKADMKQVLREIIDDTQRSESQGEAYGYAAYEQLIARLDNGAFFENADNAALEQFQKALDTFFWFHAESRGATGEGFNELCAKELNAAEEKIDVSCNGFWGYNGHQISSIGCTALEKGAAALRDQSHRDILIHGLRMLWSNDEKIIWMLKRAIGLDMPAPSADYCVRVKDMMLWASKALIDRESAVRMAPLNAEQLLSVCHVINTHQVDFGKDIEKAMKIKKKLTKHGLELSSGGSMWGMTGHVRTKRSFRAPLKIEACITGKETSVGLFYNNGFFKSAEWRNKASMVTRDIYLEYSMDFQPDAKAILSDDIHITWIIQRDFMAAIVNGALVHYAENMPYTYFDMPKASVGIGTFDDKTIVVKSLTVSELD